MTKNGAKIQQTSKNSQFVAFEGKSQGSGYFNPIDLHLIE